MSLITILLAVPFFFIIYQGMGLFFESRANKLGPSWQARASSSSSALGFKQFAVLSGKLGFNRTILRYQKLKDRLDMLLLLSGHPFGWKAEDLLFCKELLSLVVSVWLWRVGAAPMLCLIGLGLGFWIPDLYMQTKGAARMAEIQKKLPGFVDLSALALESGLDLMAAIDRILQKMKPSSLRDELQTLMQENRLGTPRKEAFQHLAHRVNLPDIQSLTSIIIQSEELGTSLASVLRNYAEDMRNRRVLRAEELAGKMPVKLLFPMMVFFFPIVFVVIFGPLAINFMNAPK